MIKEKMIFIVGVPEEKINEFSSFCWKNGIENVGGEPIAAAIVDDLIAETVTVDDAEGEEVDVLSIRAASKIVSDHLGGI